MWLSSKYTDYLEKIGKDSKISNCCSLKEVMPDLNGIGPIQICIHKNILPEKTTYAKFF